MEKLFDSEQEAATTIALGKSTLLIAPNGERICVSHTKEGFFALQNTCSHAGADLHKGFINEQNEIVCPLHHYCFNLKTGNATRGNAISLKTYRLEWKFDETTQQNSLFIDL